MSAPEMSIKPRELYRHYAADGTLLYVGTSLSTVARLASHRHASKWFTQISRVAIERFHSEDAALEAEMLAIRREEPLYNVVHTLQRRRRDPQRELVQRSPAGGLSDKRCRAAKPGSKLADRGAYGEGRLWLMVTKAGRRNWIFRTQTGGKDRARMLGQFPDMSLADARAAARALSGKPDALAPAGSLGDLLDAYCDSLAGRPSERETRATLKRIPPTPIRSGAHRRAT